MPKLDTPRVIDGFTSVQAVKRHGPPQKDPHFRPSSSRLPERKAKPAGNKTKTPSPPRVGHTAVPKRNEITCFECGYEFVLRGRIERTYCPKCRKILKVEDLVIEGECRTPIKTIGTITIKPDAVVHDVGIMAGRIILSGDIRAADVRLCNRLELCAGARFDVARLNVRDITVRSGARISVRHKVACRNLDVAGELRAHIVAAGKITVKPGGLLRGNINSAHLTVEEGGGLRATLNINPLRPAAATKKTEGAKAHGN